MTLVQKYYLYDNRLNNFKILLYDYKLVNLTLGTGTEHRK